MGTRGFSSPLDPKCSPATSICSIPPSHSIQPTHPLQHACALWLGLETGLLNSSWWDGWREIQPPPPGWKLDSWQWGWVGNVSVLQETQIYRETIDSMQKRCALNGTSSQLKSCSCRFDISGLSLRSVQILSNPSLILLPLRDLMSLCGLPPPLSKTAFRKAISYPSFTVKQECQSLYFLCYKYFHDQLHLSVWNGRWSFFGARG